MDCQNNSSDQRPGTSVSTAATTVPSKRESGNTNGAHHSKAHGAKKKPRISGTQITYELIREYPENFDHVRYLKFLKESLIQTAKEELAVKTLISPFYNSLPSIDRSKTVKSSEEPVPHVHLEEPTAQATRNMEAKTLLMKVKATVAAVMHDNRIPKKEHLLFLRSLNQLIVDMLEFSASKCSKMRLFILAAAQGVDHLFNCNMTKDSDLEEYMYKLEETGVEYLLNYLVDFVMRDYTDPFVQMIKTSMVLEVIQYLKPTSIRRRMFELLCTGAKTCLGHIHRADRNIKNDGLLPMNYIETLFNYLRTIESIIAMLPFIQDSELVTLQCIEKTVAGSLKYPNISIMVARIATLAANSPRTPPRYVKRKTGPILIRQKPLSRTIYSLDDEDELLSS